MNLQLHQLNAYFGNEKFAVNSYDVYPHYSAATEHTHKDYWKNYSAVHNLQKVNNYLETMDGISS